MKKGRYTLVSMTFCFAGKRRENSGSSDSGGSAGSVGSGGFHGNIEGPADGLKIEVQQVIDLN